VSNDNSSAAEPGRGRSALPPWALVALATVSALAGLWLGYPLAQLLVVGVATATDRDVTELKDMVISAAICGPIVGAAGAVWLALIVCRAGQRARTTAMAAFALLTVAGAAMMATAFDWPKASGAPVVRYELRLPPGTEVNMGNIDFGIWAGRSGHGVYVERIAQVDGRPLVRGDFTLRQEGTEEVLALRIGRGPARRWRVPIAPDAKLEKDYGPWQRIEFLPGSAPAEGDGYEIRYRVRKYL